MIRRFTKVAATEAMMLRQMTTAAATQIKSLSPELCKLPNTKVIDNIEVKIHKFDMSRFEEAYALYKASGETGDGYTKFEVERNRFYEKWTKSEIIVMDNANTGEIISIIPFNDSPACRSTHPLLCTVQALVNPKNRGKGVVFELYKISEKYSMDLGYLGFNARALITGRNILPTRKMGGMVVGYIPYCSHVDGVGHIDDVLLAKDFHLNKAFPDFYESIVTARGGKAPIIDITKPIPEEFMPKRSYDPKDIQTPSGRVRIRTAAGKDDIIQVENLWRDAADRAEGFGTDEFREDGYFNRKFFREANILVAENSLGIIIGASVFGPSALSRSENPVLATLYVTCTPTTRRQRVGTSLLQYSMELLKKDGFKGVISDTYVNNYQMLGLLRKTIPVLRISTTLWICERFGSNR